MTLLNLDNLASIQRRIPQLEKAYAKMVGMSVYEFCCQAMGVDVLSESKRAAVKVASVPITAGGGAFRLQTSFAHASGRIRFSGEPHSSRAVWARQH